MIFIYAIFVLLGISFPQNSAAYSSFISYGYNSCLTCHYNGQGNGPLNDYGRALFSAEISSRAVFNDKLSDEAIAAKSGFLGSTELPWWIRPGVKYRGLYFMSNPGSEAAVNKYVTMQADLNLAVQLNQAAEYLIVVSGGYSPTPASRRGVKEPEDKNLISREHYFRWQTTKKLFTYIGLMDKVFGIRTSDHTAYSRSVTGLAQNDQAHGVALQYYGSGWELTGHAFAGNVLQEKSDVRQVGASMMYEYDIKEDTRWGISALSSKNEFVTKNRLALHSKMGIEKGSSLLVELGVIQDSPKSNASDQKGGYLMMESIYALSRGYNLLSQVEYYNATLSKASPDLTRWTFGLLMFPMPRMELRTNFVNGRSLSDTAVSKDQWMLQTQLHLSL